MISVPEQRCDNEANRAQSGSSRDVLHGVSVVGVSDSVSARTPGIKQIAEVCTIDVAIGVDVTSTSRRSTWAVSPLIDQDSEVGTVNAAVTIQVCAA
jgi:hypothetical protein